MQCAILCRDQVDFRDKPHCYKVMHVHSQYCPIHRACATAAQTLSASDEEAHRLKTLCKVLEDRLAAAQAEAAAMQRASQQQITQLEADCQAAASRAHQSSQEVYCDMRLIASTSMDTGLISVLLLSLVPIFLT